MVVVDSARCRFSDALSLEHKDDFDQYFPADYICEGIDRPEAGSFMMANPTLMKASLPYKNVLVNDMR